MRHLCIGDKRGHPALASDLMEEWRAVIIDSMVFNIATNGILHAEDFYVSNKN